MSPYVNENTVKELTHCYFCDIMKAQVEWTLKGTDV